MTKTARTWRTDTGHNLTERELGKLQLRIEGVYEECRDDMEKTAAEYWEKLKAREAKMQKHLERGEITKEQYQSWYLAQVGRGKNFEALRDRLAERVVDSTSYALDIIRDKMPSMYAINRNYAAYQIESITGADFALWDEYTVKRLLVEKPDLMPHYSVIKSIDKGRNLAYCKTKITDVVTSGILQGWSIDKMAKRLAEDVSTMEMHSAIRAARTATTSAENAGRLDSYDEAVGMGVEMEKEWMATLDSRTRHSHAALDGQHVPVNKSFSNGLKYPADPHGAASEVYNCRCTMVAWFPELKKQNDSRYTYSKWKADKEARGESIGKGDKVSYDERVAKTKAQSVFDNNLANKVSPQTIAERLQNLEYTPCLTQSEAEAFASKYVNTGGFGSVGLSYQGVNIDVANEINKALQSFYSVFDVPNLGGLAAPAKNTKLGKIINANAAYSPVRESLLLDRNKTKSVGGMIESLLSDRDAVKKVLAHPERYDLSKMSKSVRAVIEASEKSGRGLVPETVEEAICHELGHHLEKSITKDELALLKVSMVEYGGGISGYAASGGVGEYIAESTAAYLKGEAIKDPNMMAVFERLKR